MGRGEPITPSNPSVGWVLSPGGASQEGSSWVPQLFLLHRPLEVPPGVPPPSPEAPPPPKCPPDPHISPHRSFTILYNRTMVQLGICAFREGLIKDAHNALLDIQSSGRAKELLGQGLLLRSLQERNPEQEKVEKRRQVPFHMHVNLELLECVYLVAAMLLEIPYMAAHEFDARRRMISKQFHHQLRVGERQPLLGPPESMREHVVAASKAMKMGDWRSCHRFVVNEKMNGKVWDLFPEADKVRAMLVRWVGGRYLTLSITPIISKMSASLDQPTATVMMHRTEPTAQQNLALVTHSSSDPRRDP
uniref:Eukaryotic translation initiation factor 3 subunit C N-terminal domain-containing protein n=1 Tax=Calidris pygmaea TaxID=425635 RepID=A0A8C3JYD5_9CHAR